MCPFVCSFLLTVLFGAVIDWLWDWAACGAFDGPHVCAGSCPFVCFSVARGRRLSCVCMYGADVTVLYLDHRHILCVVCLCCVFVFVSSLLRRTVGRLVDLPLTPIRRLWTTRGVLVSSAVFHQCKVCRVVCRACVRAPITPPPKPRVCFCFRPPPSARVRVYLVSESLSNATSGAHQCLCGLNDGPKHPSARPMTVPPSTHTPFLPLVLYDRKNNNCCLFSAPTVIKNY